MLVGANGTGKTTLLEAVAYLGSGRSFRGSPKEALVRHGATRAVVRATLEAAGGRGVLAEAEISLEGRSRAQLNRQPARSRRALAEAVPHTLFSPDDLSIVQGAPQRRRDVLDDALRLLNPPAADAIDETERVLRQRAALLRQAAGRLRPDVGTTLDVWDERLARAGTTLAAARAELVARLVPLVDASYDALAGGDARAGAGRVVLSYRMSWDGDLAGALATARAEDLRRAATTVGPHRDDLVVTLGGRDARTQASQGEQRCLALSLRLAVHRLATTALGTPPLLLLDDVFSELDPDRSRALVRELPEGQTLLTTATPLPSDVTVASTVTVPTDVATVPPDSPDPPGPPGPGPDRVGAQP